MTMVEHVLASKRSRQSTCVIVLPRSSRTVWYTFQVTLVEVATGKNDEREVISAFFNEV